MSHTKEPWPHFTEHGNLCNLWTGYHIRIKEPDYNRARACVNACAGMLEPEGQINYLKGRSVITGNLLPLSDAVAGLLPKAETQVEQVKKAAMQIETLTDEVEALRNKGSVDLAVLANAVRHHLPEAETNLEQVKNAAEQLKYQEDEIKRLNSVVVEYQGQRIAADKEIKNLKAVAGEWHGQLMEAIGAKDYLFKKTEELEEIRQQQRKQIEALQIELSRQPFDQGTLRQFIAGVEARNFRTVHDTGANQNAMFLWNQLRRFAGLPEITRDSLPAYCVTCKTYHRDPHERKKEQVSQNEGSATAAYPGGRWTPNPVQSSESTPVRPQLDAYEAHLVGSDPKPWDGSVTIVAESLGDALNKACEIAIEYGGVVLGVRKRIDPAREPHPGLV